MNSIHLKVADIHVELRSNAEALRESVLSRLSPAFLHRSQKAQLTIDFQLKHGHGRKRSPLADLYEGSRFEQGKLTLCCPFRPPNRSWLYHVGFLQPLCIGLLHHRSALVHAALVAKNADAILLCGDSGAGKSTLSLLFALRGYTLYADEHAILSLSGNELVGRGFFGPIALARHSLMFLKDSPVKAIWNRLRGKYLVDCEQVSTPSLLHHCVVRKLVFPEFTVNRRTSIRSLSPEQTLKRLLKDEYIGLSTVSQDTSLTTNHLRLLDRLAHSARSYAINYGLDDVIKMPKVIEDLP